jgi:hypothetical protein
LTGSNSSTLLINGSTFTDISISTNENENSTNNGNGGICNIMNFDEINILNSDFENISLSLKGGALFFENIEKEILIENNDFINIESINDGGAIYFSSNTYFEIWNNNFDKCSSKEGHGGAISSISKNDNYRLIMNSNFSENVAKDNIGIDIYDSSNNSEIYYDRNTIINCLSTSFSGAAYILFAGTKEVFHSYIHFLYLYAYIVKVKLLFFFYFFFFLVSSLLF